MRRKPDWSFAPLARSLATRFAFGCKPWQGRLAQRDAFLRVSGDKPLRPSPAPDGTETLTFQRMISPTSRIGPFFEVTR